MKPQISLRLLDTPSNTLMQWQRELLHLLNNLTSAGYVAIKAIDIPITDSGAYYPTDDVENALQYVANIALSNKIKVTTKTITSTLVSTDSGVILCNSATPIALNLPTAVGAIGLSFAITNINAGAVTVTPVGAETIEGEATFVLYQDENIQIVSNNAIWFVR